MDPTLKHLRDRLDKAPLWLLRLLRGREEQDFELIRESHDELRRLGIHVSLESPAKKAGRVLRPDRETKE